MANKLLEINGLTIERGERLLLDNCSIDVSQGQVLEVSGPNGSGKTSLLRTIAGLIEPLEGEFRWRGKAASNVNLFSDELLYLGHKPAVRMQLNPIENLCNFGLTQGGADIQPDKLVQALADLGLKGYEHELCSRLSAGQKRRVGLARLRFTNAALWVLDEPFTAIDARGVEHICSWIDEFVLKGGSVIYTTHQPVQFPSVRPNTLALAVRS